MLSCDADAFLDIFPLLLGDGGMRCRAFVGHQDPEAVPHDPETPWEQEGERKQAANVTLEAPITVNVTNSQGNFFFNVLCSHTYWTVLDFHFHHCALCCVPLGV